MNLDEAKRLEIATHDPIWLYSQRETFKHLCDALRSLIAANEALAKGLTRIAALDADGIAARKAASENYARAETAEARADAAEALVKELREALEFYAPSEVNGITFAGGDDAGHRAQAVLAQQPPTASTEYERKVAQMKGDFPNGI